MDELDKLIEKYIEYAIKAGICYYEECEYAAGDKYHDKTFELWVRMSQFNNGKMKFEELLKNENDYVVTSVAISLINEYNSNLAKKALSKIADKHNNLGREMKAFLKRCKTEKMDNKYILEKKKKILEKINKEKKNYNFSDSVIEEEQKVDSNNSNKLVDFQIPIFTTDNDKEINEYFKSLYPNSELTVIKDNGDLPIKIDINIMKQPESKDYILYTIGMSSIPMNVPKTIFNKYGKYKYGELVIQLPKDWGDNYNNEKWKFIISLIKFLGYYPHFSNTWLGDSHSLEQFGDLMGNTNFEGVVLYYTGFLKNKGKNIINFYTVVLLYKNELEYKLNHGCMALLSEFEKSNENPRVLIIDRKNVIN